MLRREDKRGLSEVVTNLLIILLVLVAIGVVWVVVRNILSEGASDIEIGRFTFDLRIESAYVSGADVVVTVRRNTGGDTSFLGMNLIFTNNTASTTIKKLVSLSEGGIITFTFTPSEIPGTGAGNEVSVVPIYSSSGQERPGSITDTETISGTAPPGTGGGSQTPVCGNSNIEAGETCDDGGTLPDDGCSATCQIETPPACDNDNQIDPGEFCDGTDLGIETCQSLGYDGGDLSCNSNCAFDISQCTNAPGGGTTECSDGLDNDGDLSTDLADTGCADSNDNDETNCGDNICEGGENFVSCPADCEAPTPPSCGDGVWNQSDIDDGNECDGNPLPNGCSISCTCEPGFTNNSAGSCDLDPPLNTGTILSIWNSIYFDSNDLPKDDSVGTYQGSYVNFSGTIENGCFLITLADYVPDSDRSYLRVEDTFGAPNIAVGNGYEVWEAENCGQ